MRFLMWAIAGLWIVNALLSLLAMTIQPGNHCLRAIVIDAGYRASYEATILDVRTGLTFPTVSRSSQVVSPDGNYYYTTPDFSAIQNNITRVSTATQERRILYETTNEVAAMWAADSQSMFIMGLTSNNRVGRTAHRLIQIDINTGEVLRDYPVPSSSYIEQSPDYRYFYVTEEIDGVETLISYDTLTGERTNFQFSPVLLLDSWSPDNQWMVLEDETQLLLVNAETGALHPMIESIPAYETPVGYDLVWTADSLWFQAIDRTYQRIDLRDGTVYLEYENAEWVNPSPHDRVRDVALHEDDGFHRYIHDTLNNSYSPLLISVPTYSEDERCLLGLHLSNETDSSVEILIIYDLETMQAVYLDAGNSISTLSLWNLYWYGEE